MIRRMLGALALLLALPCVGAQLRIETRLEPAGPTVIGQTVQLQVDVLTDSWFTSAPQLPVLELDNATVSAPSGEARHLNLSRDSTPFFGLEYTYRITPNAAGDLAIPGLTISATPGPSSTPMSVRSEPLRLTVEQPAGLPAGQSVLVARKLTLSQDISPSRSPLGIGDSVRRRITQIADGVQMMLMTAPVFAQVDGLKQYLAAPQLKPMDDGRGHVSGGIRVDDVSYVITRSGDFQLPAINVQWWDSDARQLRIAQVPAATFSATGAAFHTPFSVREDLQRMGRHGRITLSRHGLALGLGLLAIGLLLYLGWPRCLRAWQTLKQHRATRHRQWLASPRYALNQIPEQLRATPPRLDALYLWVHRQYGATGLGVLRDRVPRDLTAQIYGRDPQPANAFHGLSQSPALLHPHTAARHPNDAHRLQPLNPRTFPRIKAPERTP